MQTNPDDVPRFTKRPKSRQPSGLREKILRTAVPFYSGPYSVGMMDIEVPARDPRHFSDITRHKRHLLELRQYCFRCSILLDSDLDTASPRRAERSGAGRRGYQDLGLRLQRGMEDLLAYQNGFLLGGLVSWACSVCYQSRQRC